MATKIVKRMPIKKRSFFSDVLSKILPEAQVLYRKACAAATAAKESHKDFDTHSTESKLWYLNVWNAAVTAAAQGFDEAWVRSDMYYLKNPLSKARYKDDLAGIAQARRWLLHDGFRVSRKARMFDEPTLVQRLELRVSLFPTTHGNGAPEESPLESNPYKTAHGE